jgi:hypothetical protein
MSQSIFDYAKEEHMIPTISGFSYEIYNKWIIRMNSYGFAIDP